MQAVADVAARTATVFIRYLASLDGLADGATEHRAADRRSLRCLGAYRCQGELRHQPADRGLSPARAAG
jgi:hypothetical protein